MTEPAALPEPTAQARALIPILGAMELEVLEVTPHSATARIPAEPNVNHFGAMYAGCLFTVAEVLGGLMAGFMNVPGALPLVKRVEIDFTRPALTAVTARTTLSEEEFDRVQAEATANGKSNYELTCEVTDEAGTVVARTRGYYQMRVMG
ncbi:thioesterase domain-containing protein [Aeromicrobium panaciterrae]|uniref:Thioesterase domain-containing protein n=1 Tax=Aeromicrobium panaciterrae TaxID=363861 RepID=A0ABU1UMC1_9ACTN|nr:YiiD C-terminal domain-containing protein [Aeromicrobium panaciterrae]MDR7086308.1 thioesterase domain-containing protein [Aeromicrobium panaciterrae]